MSPVVADVFNWLLALVISLSVHEWAHAFVAKVQGDDTAEREGRLTFNPLAHLDPIGTVILPVVMMVTVGGMFGWAKPVPVDVSRLRSQRWGHMYVAAAGPLSNLILCFGFMLATFIYIQQTGEAAFADESRKDLFIALAKPMIHINAILAVFNLIPLPPLDGGAVFSAFLPEELRYNYHRYVAPYGMFILMALMLTGSLTFVSMIANEYIELTQKLVIFLLF